MTVSPKSHGEVIRILKLSRGPTRVQPGCLSFNYYQDLEDGNTILVEQVWNSPESFERYLGSDEFSNILVAFEQSAREPVIQIHDVSKTSGMEFIRKVRAPKSD